MKTLALLLVLAAPALADPDLRLRHEPRPRHLRMRPRAAAATPATTASPAPSSIPKPVAASPIDSGAEAIEIRDTKQPLQLRFNLGYQVDGTAFTGAPALNGRPVSDEDFRTIRSYGFGEGFVSTHGVVTPSLSTYFAGRFIFAPIRSDADGNPTRPPISTWFGQSVVPTARDAWAEVKDFLPNKSLAPLRLRAGQLYVYGPWVLHMYGLVAAWDGKLVRATLYGGSRVPDYTNAIDDKNRAGIGGASLRIDLRDLKTPIPFTIAGEALGFTEAGSSSQASEHTQVELDWRPRRDLALIGKARTLDRKLASEHLQFRSRYKQVTNLVFDLTHRHETDWRWDPSVIGADRSLDPAAPRRYLELGPVLPQLLVSGRAGTLIKENIDLFARGAIAADLSPERALKHSFSASYLELGGALEVRLRRTIAFGASALTRQTQRRVTLADQIRDDPGEVDPLPPSAATGERGFVELGVSLKMSLGARRFSANIEAYGRRTRYALDYCTDTRCGSSQDTGVQFTDIRGGGRIAVDAWIGNNARLFAAYDVTSRIDYFPDITGFKSLRLMMEGVY